MKRFLYLTIALLACQSVQSQTYPDPYDDYFGIYDTMGIPKFVLISDKDRWLNLKEGERVPAYNESLEFIGYYTKNRKGRYEIETPE
ncbi:MAG: hypothetical protein EOO01_25960 [Chitinophagaceae bacterium]|nr:MAG: hypothetical protein EOO01_25960 [Chitinophagaceae bacterium]